MHLHPSCAQDAADKAHCECGAVVAYAYLEKHLHTKTHRAWQRNVDGVKRKATAKPGASKVKTGEAASTSADTFDMEDDAWYASKSQISRECEFLDYAVPLGRAHFDAHNALLMTNPYHREDAYIYR